MKILKVIHGYPPLYNAGSEVYSQMLCHGLAKNHEVHVFTREENPFAEDFSLRVTTDPLEPKVKIYVTNIPGDKFRYRYQHPQVDHIFSELLEKIAPNVVHIGHLSHLSTSLVFEIAKRNIPIIYTLHDYWLMCPRGQFIQRNSQAPAELWSLCDGQEDRKCAEKCYAGYFSGAAADASQDIAYWSSWIHKRMAHIKAITQHISCFIAPSNYLYQRYLNEFNLPKSKLIHLDYGFDLQRLQNRQRNTGEPFTFGYIGTHIPAKGVQDLIKAFGQVQGNCQLRIWGRPRPQNTDGLKAIAAQLPGSSHNNIHWLPEYRNEKIIEDVFNHVDCIVVPSIWVENSPLVIHEALQARVPVITADVGGMAEYIQHEINGLLFKHRDIDNLAQQMQVLVDNPLLAEQLGKSGYSQSTDNNIPSLALHISAIEKIYGSILDKNQVSTTIDC